MRAVELMSAIPGITMDHLHNWERQGYVSPSRISVGKKEIRDYSGKDVYFLKTMWSYYQKGCSPKNAYRNAAEAAIEDHPRPLVSSKRLSGKSRGPNASKRFDRRDCNL